MEIKFLNQPKEIKLGEVLQKRLKENFDKVYLIAGMAKDTALEDLYEDLNVASNNIKDINILIGIDRKNISKDMLLKIISLGINLSVHINTDEDKVETRCYIFESKENDSYIYITGAKFSSGGLFNNATLVEEIKYSKGDRKEFLSAMASIKNDIDSDFHNIDKDEVILLAEKGEIVARIKDRKIPKISEVYGNSEEIIGEKIYDESTSTIGNTSLNFLELADVDIEFDPVVTVGKKLELEVEKEFREEQAKREEELKSLKKKESDLERLYNKPVTEKEIKTKIHKSDAIDYANMSTLIIEAGKISENGADAGELKIPKSIAENMINFFGGISKFQTIVDEKGKSKTKQIMAIELIDNKDNINIIDNGVEIILNDKGISIKSKEILNKQIQIDDIIRIIKTDKIVIEIIRKDTAEYNIWNAYLVNNVRGNKRRFGIQ